LKSPLHTIDGIVNRRMNNGTSAVIVVAVRS
jgi:hypothetical protein